MWRCEGDRVLWNARWWTKKTQTQHTTVSHLEEWGLHGEAGYKHAAAYYMITLGRLFQTCTFNWMNKVFTGRDYAWPQKPTERQICVYSPLIFHVLTPPLSQNDRDTAAMMRRAVLSHRKARRCDSWWYVTLRCYTEEVLWNSSFFQFNSNVMAGPFRNTSRTTQNPAALWVVRTEILQSRQSNKTT